tara:strand:- start:367 stop:1332 length:966 start_codon:yes stop_codon:yes gene_type:complete
MKIAMMGSIHTVGWEKLKENNCEVFEITNFENSSLKKELADVDGIALRTAKLSSDILSSCKKLKIISRHGVGYDNVDTIYLNQNKIALAITGTSNSISVAEHVMTMFLYLTKKINLSDTLTKKGDFNKKHQLPDFFELYNKNILIFGFGRIGQALAKRCLGFEAKVYVHDPFVNENLIKKNNCQPISKEEGLILADYISIHLPLNNKTKNFISFEEFNKLKQQLIIVNTARGGIINEEALYLALKNNKIRGAGLDVFEKEPPIKNNPLFSLANIILSPHNAALTLECRKRMALELSENIIYYLKKDQRLNKNNLINSNILE